MAFTRSTPNPMFTTLPVIQVRSLSQLQPGRIQTERTQSVVLYPNIIPPVTIPVISNLTPADQSEITQYTPISFDLTDPSGFRRIILSTPAPDGSRDFIWDGNGSTGVFHAPYRAGSSAIPVMSGGKNPIVISWHFTILRDGGWKIAPNPTVEAINPTGNEL